MKSKRFAEGQNITVLKEGRGWGRSRLKKLEAGEIQAKETAKLTPNSTHRH
jgi:hypothetical protein